MKLRQFEYSSKAQKARVNAWRNEVAGNNAELMDEAQKVLKESQNNSKIRKKLGRPDQYKNVGEAKKAVIRRNLEWADRYADPLKSKQRLIYNGGIRDPKRAEFYKEELRLKKIMKDASAASKPSNGVYKEAETVLRETEPAKGTVKPTIKETVKRTETAAKETAKKASKGLLNFVKNHKKAIGGTALGTAALGTGGYYLYKRNKNRNK